MPSAVGRHSAFISTPSLRVLLAEQEFSETGLTLRSWCAQAGGSLEMVLVDSRTDLAQALQILAGPSLETLKSRNLGCFVSPSTVPRSFYLPKPSSRTARGRAVRNIPDASSPPQALRSSTRRASTSEEFLSMIEFLGSVPRIQMKMVLKGLFLVLAAAALFCGAAAAQQADPTTPVVVQPGAPGQPSKKLSPSTAATLPPKSHTDVEFMQGMIMHHAQAVEMTALIASHTQNKDLQVLGARISRSQSDEIKFMRRWLAARGEATSMPMPEMPGMDMSHQPMLMPGMLTPPQMEALRKAKDAKFDDLFLTGMVQHHHGALIMVKDLFDTAGAGQDAELFDFATDVDSGQRAEIRIMQAMLEKKPSEEKR